MNPEDLTLNIAVNLGRISRWAIEGKRNRIDQFIADTDFYVQELEKAPKNERFNKTFNAFVKKYNNLKKNVRLEEDWAEDMLTWANILTHRAKLAN